MEFHSDFPGFNTAEVRGGPDQAVQNTNQAFKHTLAEMEIKEIFIPDKYPSNDS